MRLVSLLGLSVAFASSALGCAASAEPGAQGDQGGGGESTAATSEDLKANGIFSIKSQAFGCVAQDSIGRAVIRRLGFHDAVAFLTSTRPLSHWWCASSKIIFAWASLDGFIVAAYLEA